MNTPPNKLILIAGLCLLLLLSLTCFAQDDPSPSACPAQTDEQKENARRTERAGVRKAEAEAKSAELENLTKQLAFLKGDHTEKEDSMFIENEIAAYKASTCLADSIYNQIKYRAAQKTDENGPLKINYLILFDDNFAAAFSHFSAVKSQMQSILAQFNKILPDFRQKITSESEKLSDSESKSAKLLQKEKLLVDITTLQQSVAKISGPGFTPGGIIADVALSVLSLFKTDTKMTGAKATTNDSAFVAQIANAFCFPIVDRYGNPMFDGRMNRINNCPQVLDPDRITVTSADLRKSTFFTSLQELLKKNAEAKKLVELQSALRKDKLDLASEQEGIASAEKKVTALEAKVDELTEKLDQATGADRIKLQVDLRVAEQQLKTEKGVLREKRINVKNQMRIFDRIFEDDLVRLNLYISSVDSFISSLRGEDNKPGAGSALLTDYLKAEKINKLVVEETPDGEKIKSGTYWFDVNIITAGGTRLRKSSIILDIIRQGPMISWSGGAIGAYKVFDFDGRVLVSDATWAYAPFKRTSKLTEYNCRFPNSKPR